MNLRILVAVTLVLVPLSGCFGNDPPPPTDSTSPGSTDGTTPTSATSSPPVGTTKPPAPPGSPNASLVVKNGATVLTPENGTITIPANAPITFDASASTDPEGAPITFAWSVDGAPENGTNATLTKAFAAGTHAVVVTVSDGTLSNSAEAVVVVPGQTEIPIPEDAVVSTKFTGKFAAQATAKFPLTFPVNAGVKQVTAYLKWGNGVGGQAASANLKLELTNASAGATATVYNAALDYEYVRINDTTKLPSGTWTGAIVPDANTGAETTYDLTILVWYKQPNTVSFEETVQGEAAVATETVITKKVALPAGTEAVAARLTWLSPDGGTRCAGQAYSADFDLTVKVDSATASSGNSEACEFAYVDAEPEEALTDAPVDGEFGVTPYVSPNNRYTLTIDYA